MADDESEYLKLPVEDRCVHKIWKARVSGYEEAVKLFAKWDGDDGNWKKFQGLVKKFIIDSNAVAQEKGLEAALAYVENCDNAGKYVGDCVEGIVTKCVAAPKAKTKDLAKQIALMFVEIEQSEKVIEELLKGLTQKNPKVVSGCINVITSCLHAFGAKVIKVSPLLKGVVPLLDHRDKVVREEGKQLVIEAYRWVGEVMKQQLSGIKPVQLAELESEFANMDGAKAKPERLLRSQQQFGAVVEADSGNAEGSREPEEEEAEEDTDPYDLLDPVDILEKLPKNFYELVEEKKWQLRKEALDALFSLSQTPKIQPGEFSDLVRVLKKFISKDTNVMLVTLAAQCIAGIAKGLRQSFKNGSNQLLPAVLEKFKEKKVTVVAALAEAADAIYCCIGIEGIQEDCLATLQHKTPNVVVQTALLLARSFAKSPAAIVTNKKMAKGYILALGEKLAHSDPNVRESASEAIGVCLKILGEPTITKLMPDLEAIKLTRIKEFAEKAEITGKMPKQAPAADDAKASKAKVVKPGKPGPKVVKPGASKTVAKPIKDDIEPDDDVPVVENKRPATTKATPKKASTTKRPVVSAKAGIGSRKKEEVDTSPPYVANTLKNQRFKDETRLKVLKWNFQTPRQDVIEQLKDQMIASSFSAMLIPQLFHNDFKQHLKAIDTLTKYIKEDKEGLISNLDLLLKWTTLRFFETNPQSLLRSLDYINQIFIVLAEESYSLHDIEAVSFIPYLINKVGDPKDQVRNSIKQIFKYLCQVYPVSKFSPYLMNGLQQKNAKLRAECLDELGGLIKNYGMNVLQPTPAACLKEVAKSIADRDRAVRDGALNAITEAYFQVGEKMYKMVGNLKEKDSAMLEERIKRVSKTRPPPGGPTIEPPAPPPQSHQAPQNHNDVQGNDAGSRETQSNVGPKSSLPTATGRTFKNFRQFPVPPGVIPPSSDVTRRSPSASNSGIPNPMLRGQTATKLDRPVSGAFTLDLDKIEGERNGNMDSRTSGPQLVNHNLDEIFNDDPIALPMYRRPTSGISQYGQAHNLMSPVGSRTVPGRPLQESQEAKEALDVVFAQLFNTQDTAACLNALTQLDEVIKDDEKVILLGDRMDQLLIACWTQYRHVLNTKMAADNYNVKDVTRLLQFVTMVLMSMYHHQDLTKKASMSTLHDLLHVIISILLEPKVQQLPEPDGGQLIRALNVLTVKILDRSDSTNVTSAFIKLLRDCVGNTSLSPKFVELVMKCLWKVIRQLPKWMESNKLNLDLLLADLHEFLKAYPSSYWKRQESDTPMRTVKTVLHTMAKAKGDAILDHLSRINDPSNSELVPYLRKLLNSGVGGKENQATHNQDDNSNVIMKNGNNKANAPGEIMQKPRFTKSDHEALAEIFKKIGQKEQTKIGLQELYRFKQQNPQADLEPFLAKSSPYFRNYIERGLKGIEDENKTSYSNRFTSQNILSDTTKGMVNTGNGNTGTNDGGSSNSGGEIHLNYLDKLNMLRKQAGLEAYLDKNGTTSSASSGIGTGSTGSDLYKISSSGNSGRVTANEVDRYSDNSSSSSTVTLKASYEKKSYDTMSDYVSNEGGPATDVEDIRKRLDRIKHNLQ